MSHTYVIWSVVLLLGGTESSDAEASVISVKNGGKWGEWGLIEYCPQGYRAAGFILKVESPHKLDDTALNGIGLECRKLGTPETFAIRSKVGEFGQWKKTIWCPGGYLSSFSLKVEKPQKIGDDTAANNIMFRCTDGSMLEGDGTNWGKYDAWSEVCLKGICSIQTKVEASQGMKDDTALNDVRFTCCSDPLGIKQK